MQVTQKNFLRTLLPHLHFIQVTKPFIIYTRTLDKETSSIAERCFGRDTVNDTINFLSEKYRIFCNDLLDIGKRLRA